jgi:hypothetical protein
MRASPQQLLADLETFGLIFESLVVRDLRVLAQPLDGQVLHFRDNKGLEVDAVVACDDGRWGAFEVKLGLAQVEGAARTLLRFAESVDTRLVGPPAVLAVIVPTGLSFRRADGVQVVALGSLGP